MGTEVVKTAAIHLSCKGTRTTVGDSKDFICDYVAALFDERLALSHEESAKFGEFMKNGDARLAFAKHIDARRVGTKCLGEITFYKLLHSFALVLFECSEADSFKPAKILMNMAFTYYHIPSVKQVAFEQTIQLMGNNHIARNVSENSTKVKSKKNYASKMVVNLEKALGNCVEALKEFDIVVDIRGEKNKRKKLLKNFWIEVYQREKYLYEYLKNQTIWKSERFWEEAFFTAVGSERERRCTLTSWSKLSAEERQEFDDAIANITFGQLGSFINNMKYLGISKDRVREFLHKHAIIGGIEAGGELYQMLFDQT